MENEYDGSCALMVRSVHWSNSWRWSSHLPTFSSSRLDKLQATDSVNTATITVKNHGVYVLHSCVCDNSVTINSVILQLISRTVAKTGSFAKFPARKVPRDQHPLRSQVTPRSQRRASAFAPSSASAFVTPGTRQTSATT